MRRREQREHHRIGFGRGDRGGLARDIVHA
jgi:hypothetical protein